MTTITLPRAVVEQALHVAESAAYPVALIKALRAALAQQAEPVQVAERERVASQWDGCVTHQLDTFGPVDIGASIRAGELVEAQQAEPLQEPVEPVVRECSDPMCACRGGPCAGCEEGQREKEIEDLRSSLDFYKRRCEAIKSWQSKMRDPERTIVCDILANGFTLDPAFAGDRYTAPPQRTMVPLTEEEIFKIENDIPDDVISDRAWTICLTRAVEKAVWEKNHG